MTALKVLLAVLLVLFLLSLVRVGGDVEYSDAGLTARVRVGPFHIKVYPPKPKEKKQPPERKKTKKEPPNGPKKEPKKEPEKKKGGPLPMVKAFLPLVGDAAGALKRRVRIDNLQISLTLAGREDAAGAAMNYGYSNMLIGMIWPIFEHNFEVKDYHLHTAVDFQAREPAVYLLAAFSARTGQLVSFAILFGFKFLRAYQRGKSSANTQKG